VVKKRAGLPGGHRERATCARHDFAVSGVKTGIVKLRKLIRAAPTRHHWQFAGLRHAVVALAFVVRVGVIDAVKVNGMGKVVGVFQGDLHSIALLDANDW
jgi:hypothetical protein